jgi:hypothetical protein
MCCCLDFADFVDFHVVLSEAETVATGCHFGFLYVTVPFMIMLISFIVLLHLMAVIVTA